MCWAALSRRGYPPAGGCLRARKSQQHLQRERFPALGHPHRDLQQVRCKVNEGFFENLDLVSHLSGPDRCETQVQIPESPGSETPPCRQAPVPMAPWLQI